MSSVDRHSRCRRRHHRRCPRRGCLRRHCGRAVVSVPLTRRAPVRSADGRQGSAAAPLPFLDAARLRCGSACHRIPGESVQHAAHIVCTVTAPILSSAPGVIHSSSPWSATRELQR